MDNQEYLTVGEFARRVGVTVRTIQYYDQKGLLSPSAKGPRNERLYTECEVTALAGAKMRAAPPLILCAVQSVNILMR